MVEGGGIIVSGNLPSKPVLVVAVILLLILVSMLAWTILIGDGPSGPGVQHIEENDPLSRAPTAAPRLDLADGGVVEVRIARAAMVAEFELDPKGTGLERLKLSAKAAMVFKELGFASARRAAPWLEVTEAGRTQVIGDAQHRTKRGKKPRSRAAAAAMVGVERDLILVFDPKHHPERICERLLPLPEIEQCKPRYSRPSQAPIYPNDTEFANQWGLDNPAAGGPAQAPNFDIDAPEAWEIQQGTAEIVMAVVDSGVDISHEDLYEKIWINVDELPADFVADANALSVDPWPGILTFTDLNSSAADMVTLRSDHGLSDTNGNGFIDGVDLVAAFADGVDDDPAVGGLVDDIVGWNFKENTSLPFNGPDSDHGTAVAGLAGAMTDNGNGIAGVGWNVRILPIRGDWSWPSIQYAIDRGPDVITSSLDSYGSAMLSAIAEDLDDEGIVLLASLGNVDRYIGGTGYAELPEAIAVSNFKSTGIRAFPSGSSYSVNTDVAGPGSGTWSLDWGGGASWFGGTSGANPIVAGIVGLLKAERGDLGTEQYRQVLLKSAADIPAVTGDQGENTPGFDYYSGWGLANANAALMMVHDNPWAAANIVTPEVNFSSIKRRDQMHVIGDTVDIVAYAGLPGGGNADVTLEWAEGAPPDAAAWNAVSSANLPYVEKAVVGTLTRADLPNGIVSTRLTVEAGGRSFVGYGRVDVPRAYLDVKDNTLVFADIPVEGMAFHADFDHYAIEAAVGHTPNEADPTAWSTVGAASTVEGPPIPSGSFFVQQQLLNPAPLADLPDGEATIRAAVYDSNDNRLASFSVPIMVDKTTIPFQSGFPVDLVWLYRNGGAVAYDLSGNSQLELIVGSSPAVGDINGDGLPEVVVRANDLYTPKDDRIFVFDHQGSPVSPWEPVDPGTTNPWMALYPQDSPPVLADLDADGDLEILLSAVSDDPAVGAAVFAYQGNGDLWTTYDLGTSHVFGPPAVGDMDGDGQLDLAALGYDDTAGNQLLLYRADGAALAPAVTGLQSSPQGVSLADLDGDGDLEAVASSRYGWTYAVHHDGSTVVGWEDRLLPPGSTRIGAPVLGNLVGSDTPEVIFGFTRYTGGVARHGFYAFEGTAAPVPGFNGTEIADHSVRAQPNVFDVDNDGEMEVLIGPYNLPSEATYGFVNAVNHDGTPVADNRFPIYFTGEHPRAPMVGDLDRDGDLEYGGASNFWGGPVEAFDLDAVDDAGAVAWAMERHNPQRTSNYHGGLRLLEPTTTMPVDVGPSDDPSDRHMLLIRLRHELPHGSMAAPDLTVSIGGLDAPLTDLAEVEGERWLTVAPPDQPAPGTYMLEVEWNDGGISRVVRHRDAVIYSTAANPTDQVVVVDRSGSMLSSDKYLSARTAGNFYVSARGADDQVGVVSFHTEPLDELGAVAGAGTLTLGPDGSANRGTVAGVINGVTPPGPGAMTSIGAGLEHALNEILPDQVAGRQRALVLLSDGLENTAPFWDMGANPVRELFEQPANEDVVIHTIALGPDADRDLHAAIAEATGGTSRFVYLGNSLSIYARLADAYKQVEDLVSGHHRVFTDGRDLGLQETATFSVQVPQGATRAIFAISYRDAAAAAGLTVRDPGGAPVAGNVVTGPTSRVIVVNGVPAGSYTMDVVAHKAPTEVLATCSVATPHRLVASLAWLKPSGASSMEGVLLAMVPGLSNFRERRPAMEYLPGVVERPKFAVIARIVAPDKSETRVVLRDDGASRDGAAGDGVFAAPVMLGVGGGYSITVRAESEGQVLERTLGYFQARGNDADLDGIADSWERTHFPKMALAATNRLADLDADGLNNDEEFRYRTNPHHYDSDGDGRPDGIEVDLQTDPLKPDPALVTDTDADGDGIDDAWEQEHFPGTDPKDVDPSADPDGDGVSNFTESKTGTDPLVFDSDGDGVGDGTEAAWADPKPGSRGWRPAPSGEPPVQPDARGRLIWILLILILMLVAVIVVMLRRIQRGR
jgi:subtilisin family serine protease